MSHKQIIISIIKKRYCIGLLVLLFIYPDLRTSAQCPVREKILFRINELRTSNVEVTAQLNELLPNVGRLDSCPVLNDSVLVFLLQRLGALSYLSDDYPNAVHYTKRSVNLLASMSPGYTNPPLMARMYNYLSIFYDSLHLEREKMAAADSCVQIALRTNTVDYEILYNLLQRVTYYFETGEYERCVNFAALGETLSEKNLTGQEKTTMFEGFFNNRTNALIELHKLDQAESELTQRINSYKAAGRERLAGVLYNQLAIIHKMEFRFAQALDNLRSSLRCNEEMHFEKGCKQTLNNIAYLYFNDLHDPVNALRYYRAALSRKNKEPLDVADDILESSNILANMANVFVSLKKFDSAFYYFDQSFSLMGYANENSYLTIPTEEFVRNPAFYYVTNTIRYKADAYAAKYLYQKDSRALTEAIRIYRVADQVLARVKSTQSELQSKLAWRADAKSLYEHAIAACLDGNRMEDAFYFFEKSRAVLMNDQLVMNSRMSKNDLIEQAQINSRLASLKKELSDSMLPDARRTDIQTNIFLLTQQKDILSKQADATDRWNDERNLDSSQFALKLIRNRLLSDGKSLLEIFSGDSAVYIFLLTKQDAVLRKADKQKYDSLTRAYVKLISDPAILNTQFDVFVETSAALYQLLFSGLDLPAGQLIISPDGAYFPFEALISGAHNKNTPEYFLNDHSLSYTYSARFLLHDFQNSQNESSPRFLGIAPVVYPGDFNLAGLSGSDESINRLASFFPTSHTLIGSAATKKEFLDKYSAFSIVQLYTHASEKSTSGDPVIYFSDSALYLSELMALQSPATKMIILNACETGRGKLYEGEGIFSFNRAFAEAGVPSATVNLWSVDDQSSYRLCELFYKYLSAGLSSDIALQRAKIEFINTSGKEKRLPFYWAAPILAGQVNYFAEGNDLMWDYSVFLMAVILVISSFVIITKNLRTA